MATKRQCDAERGVHEPVRGPAVIPLTLHPAAAVPIACSLSGADQADRIRQWRDLLDGAPRERVPGGARWDLPSRLAGEAAELAAAEQGCCGFFDFTLRLAGGRMRLEAHAPADAAALFADVFGVPPGAEPRAGVDVTRGRPG